MKNPPDSPKPDARDLQIKFTIIIGLFAFIPLALMYQCGTSRQKSSPTESPSSVSTPPAIQFKNVTAEAGLDFRRESGAAGEKLLRETMGSGCALFDFD